LNSNVMHTVFFLLTQFTHIVLLGAKR
jgi:hypothetical protein